MHKLWRKKCWKYCH